MIDITNEAGADVQRTNQNKGAELGLGGTGAGFFLSI